MNKLVVGIDPHKDSLGICITHPDKDEIISSFSIKNGSLKKAKLLFGKAHKFAAELETSPVFVIESTNVFWRPIFSFLKRYGADAQTVNSYQTKNLRKTLMRKTKTDTIDAKLICDLYKQGKSHKTVLAKEPLFSLRELTRLYKFLVDIKAMVSNRIQGYLLQIFPELESILPKSSKNVLLSLYAEELIHPETIAKTRMDKLSNLLSKASHGRLKQDVAIRLKSYAKASFGLREGKVGFSFAIKILTLLYWQLENLLLTLEKERIEPLLSEVSQKFWTLKGLGTVSAASYVSELGSPHRFSNANDALAWFGLDPSTAQSGPKKGTGKRISKSGTKYGRETMFLAAGSCMLHNPELKARYKQLKAKGRKPREAKTILAADLVKILFAMYRDNSEYNPEKIKSN